MIVLDTNVLSELIKPQPSAAVLAWVDRQDPAELWITVITVAELLAGVARMPGGRRQDLLRVAVSQLIDDEFGERICDFDRAAAVEYAYVVSARKAAGRPIGLADAQIAATCRARSAVLSTRNTPDFIGTGIELFDPWSKD
ncbi:type II toxin-antitoxin system VapC family toxin [Microlunatus speluncae]|uniref:type II toxin-antitoxin system VapC family toxin n=1 Tax=Microlunatus speluncae TaxID=2594267 RepID=UPI0012661E9B|nr:type II toxin-antitoxin system VapC family toxin [Microlunatus speluncae]